MRTASTAARPTVGGFVLGGQIWDFPALHGIVFKIGAFAGYRHGYRPSGYQIQKGILGSSQETEFKAR